MADLVSLEELKTHLRLDTSDTSEDDFLSAMIVAARRGCEAQINCPVFGESRTLALDEFPGRPAAWPMPIEQQRADGRYIELPGGKAAAVNSVSYFDASGASVTVDPASYVVDTDNTPARIAPVSDWPEAARRPGAVRITYVLTGLADDDLAVVAQAVKLLCGHWYRNRESVAVDVRGIPTELPNAVTWLLSPLRQWAAS